MRGRRLHVTPGGRVRTAARAGAFVGIAFAIVGVVFGATVIPDMGGDPGLQILATAFFCLFVGVSLLIAVQNWRIASGRGDPAAASLLDVEVEPGAAEAAEAAGASPAADFADRLRKLEALRAEGLVTEAEYAEKRGQILGERW